MCIQTYTGVIGVGKMPTSIRTTTIAKTLDTIQNTLSLVNGDIGKGAEIALNAVRKELGIPLPGEQLDLFEVAAKSPAKKKTTTKKSPAKKKTTSKKTTETNEDK
jgi:hypothetical protein